MISFVFRCNFETDYCLWEASAGTQLEWERYRADTAPLIRRPPYDHTTRSQLVCLHK